MPSEDDTCRKHEVPLLEAAGWELEPLFILKPTNQSMGKGA